MAGYILRGGQQNISLPAEALDKLLQSGQGDAALLYLALQRFGRGVTPEELEKALPISRLRIDAAEQVLQQLGLLPRPAAAAVPAPAEERPVYSADDISALLQDNEGFRALLPQVEQQLGKNSAPPTCKSWPGCMTTWACPPMWSTCWCATVWSGPSAAGARAAVHPAADREGGATTGRSWGSTTRPPPPRT